MTDSQPASPATQPLRIGVIGLGMGKAHIRGYQKHPQACVVAICDMDSERLRKSAAEFSIEQTYTDAGDMFATAKLDVVSIATPNAFHKPLTLQALAAGCHVLCEKPMALTVAEAEEMAAAAEVAGKRLMINFSYRFTEQSWALHQQVSRGVLGDVYFARTSWHRRRGLPGFGGWFGQKKLAGGGPLIDLGVHRIDLALWLMGHPTPTWVMGATYDPIARRLAEEQGKAFDVEDLATALIRFDNGATLQVEASWAANIGENELMETRLFGTKAGLVQRNVGGGYDFEAMLFQEHDGALFDTRLARQPAVVSSMEHFVQSIIDDSPHLGSPREGILVQRILDAIYASAASGEPVRL